MYAPLSRNVFWIYGALQIKIIIIIIIITTLNEQRGWDEFASLLKTKCSRFRMLNISPRQQ